MRAYPLKGLHDSCIGCERRPNFIVLSSVEEMRRRHGVEGLDIVERDKLTFALAEDDDG